VRVRAAGDTSEAAPRVDDACGPPPLCSDARRSVAGLVSNSRALCVPPGGRWRSLTGCCGRGFQASRTYPDGRSTPRPNRLLLTTLLTADLDGARHPWTIATRRAGDNACGRQSWLRRRWHSAGIAYRRCRQRCGCLRGEVPALPPSARPAASSSPNKTRSRRRSHASTRIDTCSSDSTIGLRDGSRRRRSLRRGRERLTCARNGRNDVLVAASARFASRIVSAISTPWRGGTRRTT
jgi:hypothetical protein